MALTLNGSNNTIGGLAVGGLPDGSVSLADLSATGTAGSSNYLRGDNSWQEAGGGVILQAKCQSSTAGATSNTNSYAHFSGTDLALTPTASDSTLILQVSFQAWIYRSDAGDGPIAYFQVSKDDNTNYLLAPMLATGHHDTQVEFYGSVASCMRESAGNTTARTYKLYYKLGRGTSMQINPGTGATAAITVFEVAA